MNDVINNFPHCLIPVKKSMVSLIPAKQVMGLTEAYGKPFPKNAKYVSITAAAAGFYFRSDDDAAVDSENGFLLDVGQTVIMPLRAALGTYLYRQGETSRLIIQPLTHD